MMTEFLDLNAWAQWFAALDREFIFLLALPFVVAVIGLWSWWVEKEGADDEYESRAAQAAGRERRERERRERERRGGAQMPHHGLR
jgi:hypothetical protein